jgi:hypothetical protein
MTRPIPGPRCGFADSALRNWTMFDGRLACSAWGIGVETMERYRSAKLGTVRRRVGDSNPVRIPAFLAPRNAQSKPGSLGNCGRDKFLPGYRVRPSRQLHARTVWDQGAIFRHIARFSDWRRHWRWADAACRCGRGGLERRCDVADLGFSDRTRIDHHARRGQHPGNLR